MRAYELISTGDFSVANGRGARVRTTAAKPGPPSAGVCVLVCINMV